MEHPGVLCDLRQIPPPGCKPRLDRNVFREITVIRKHRGSLPERPRMLLRIHICAEEDNQVFCLFQQHLIVVIVS